MKHRKIKSFSKGQTETSGSPQQNLAPTPRVNTSSLQAYELAQL